MAMSAKSITTTSAPEIARVLGISAAKVAELAVQGVLPRAGRGLFDLAATVQAFIRFKVGIAAKGDLTARGLMVQRSRLAKEKADAAERAGKQQAGDLVPADEIEAAWLVLAATMRTRMLAIPTKTASRLAMKTAPQCEAITRKEIHEALAELSGRGDDA